MSGKREFRTLEIPEGLDGERVDDRARVIAAGDEHVYQVGKRRFARVLVKK